MSPLDLLADMEARALTLEQWVNAHTAPAATRSTLQRTLLRVRTDIQSLRRSIDAGPTR